jgi:hypothetical protein
LFFPIVYEWLSTPMWHTRGAYEESDE